MDLCILDYREQIKLLGNVVQGLYSANLLSYPVCSKCKQYVKEHLSRPGMRWEIEAGMI